MLPQLLFSVPRFLHPSPGVFTLATLRRPLARIQRQGRTWAVAFADGSPACCAGTLAEARAVVLAHCSNDD